LWGETGTGLGDERGVTGSSVSCQKRTILRAISIFQVLEERKIEQEAEVERDSVVEDFYVLHEGSFTGMWIGDVLGEVEDWFEAKARRKVGMFSVFKNLEENKIFCDESSIELNTYPVVEEIIDSRELSYATSVREH